VTSLAGRPDMTAVSFSPPASSNMTQTMTALRSRQFKLYAKVNKKPWPAVAEKADRTVFV